MKKILLYILFSFLLLECVGYLLALLHIEPTGFKIFVNNQWNDKANPYADRDSLVGVWHLPNQEWIQSGPCYTVKMNSNQYGARDNTWDTTKDGYLFLGSSFIEGYAIDYGKRVSEFFENLTHKEVYNCGMAGTFTPVQYYETIKKFDHLLKFDTCFVFFALPNDEEAITEVVQNRYRPYLSDTGIYYIRSKKAFPENKSLDDKAVLFIHQYSYAYHLLLYFQTRNILKSRMVSQEKPAGESYKGINKIMSMFCNDYPSKVFYFVMLPTMNFPTTHIPYINAPNAHIVDLRNILNLKTDFFDCNTHWNEIGHQKTAVALYDSIFRKR